ncbi:MAG: hypothetical protein K8S27_01165 [Candidatus Omnitrophica bacterium]|nr:hypothetical protein [Candidatus Omnitrophota bacterium]
MKKGAILIFLLLVSTPGCQYLENPRTLIRDPHFAEYKKQRDELEREYLRKEIMYDDYILRRDELDNIYSKEVQERQEKMNY